MLIHDFNLKVSQYYQISWLVLVFATVCLVLALSLVVWVKICLVMMIGIYAGWIWRKDIVLRSATSVKRLVKRDDKIWWLQLADGKQYAAKLDGMSVVTRFFCLLKFDLLEIEELAEINRLKRMVRKITKRRKVCVVLPDALSKKEYHALRTLLWAL